MDLFNNVKASVISEESHGGINIAYIIIYGDRFCKLCKWFCHGL